LPTDRIHAEREFHNARYGSGEDSRGHLNKFYVVISDGEKRFKRHVYRLARNRKVLEYGCADGTSAICEMKMPEVVAEYHGIDISDDAIALARQKAATAGYVNCVFCAMNAEETTFSNNEFDLIYGHGILHHVDLERSFSEIRRVLKPGGSAVFMEPLGHNSVLNWYRSRTPDLRTADEHPILAPDLELAKGFFGGVHVEFAGLTTVLAIPFQKTPLARAILSMFASLDRLLFLNQAIGLQAWYTLMLLTKKE
jgi:SAM-dependent methyltransferase